MWGILPSHRTIHANARLLRHADINEQNVLCVNCAVTKFLKTIETLHYGIEKNGVNILRRPDGQQGFTDIMLTGNADAQSEEIDWDIVINQWDLPFPKKRRARQVQTQIISV